ncbi:MAG: aminotransferase class III-fold pyridoxal phosphate-dependent enzyme [Proteobacteria bacterium]|nr:aminotransferase class III-fold pyridoxal phosphate-dependent enzyme [Pseudomonadota bacterium]
MAPREPERRTNVGSLSDEEFAAARPTSRAMFSRACGVLAGGVSHQLRYQEPFPVYVERAEGARKWDVDGNVYIDYAMGSASLLLGHAHPAVVAAIRGQAGKGTFFANCHALEVEWGALVQSMFPSAERVRFTGSGSEATSLAVRIARAYTGRSRILRFEGHYHGWHDALITGMAAPFSAPASHGVAESAAAASVVVPADLGAVEGALTRDPDIAAVILEASGASWGTVPLPAGFLAGLRALADRHRVVLILDEVITGFRWAPGGVQALTGVVPDLTTLAKILTGGLPGGAVAGKAEIMRVLDPAEEWRGRRPGAAHLGTFNGNPLVATAGIATLEQAKTGEPQRIADARAAELRAGLARILARHEVAGAVYGESSTFHLYFDARGRDGVEGLSAAELKGIPRPTVARLNRALRGRGIELMSYTGGVTSAAHSEADIARTLEVFDGVIDELAADGLVARRH